MTAMDTSIPNVPTPTLPPGVDEAALARTRVAVTFTVQPLGHVVGDVAGVLGEHVLALMGMFYPRNLCRKANVVITELVTNVVENVFDADSAMEVGVEVDAEQLVVRVTNTVSPEQRDKVEGRIGAIREAPDLRALLTKTIRERRAQRLKGGLGLMRLVHENKFDIRAERLPSSGGSERLMVVATYRVKGDE